MRVLHRKAAGRDSHMRRVLNESRCELAMRHVRTHYPLVKPQEVAVHQEGNRAFRVHVGSTPFMLKNLLQVCADSVRAAKQCIAATD
ncbi:hypothetical protein PQR08_35320 [Caballeronia jiangsuensis]|uniref:Uncharacterized protein n=1 Tax=Caballeronia jiangsuensis TaxID=1458357 RepID=A0ABW9CY31_9BURK